MPDPLSIVKYPQAILQKKAKPVEKITQDTLKLISAMEKTMELNQGVGLAAPQIGISEKIIIVKTRKKNQAFLNPQIIKEGKRKLVDEEGCLSLPGIFLKIKRANEVEVLAQTTKGKIVKILAKGLSARIFQHEIDHLNGILIINRVSPWTRFRLRKQLKNLEVHAKKTR